MLGGVAMLVLGVGIALVSPESNSLTNLITILGGLELAAGNWRYWRTRKYTQEDAITEASDTRFRAWIHERSVSGYTITILASIIVVTTIQGLAANGDALAGLMKPAVWGGEVWRLFTSPLMHASLDHLLIVAFVLVWLAKIIEQTVQRAFVPLLFLVSAVVGSLASMVLSPHTNSMGASGGIMGLLGFIVVAAYRDRTKFPPRFFKRILTIMVFLCSLAFFGFPFIDKAAHLGGMVTGMVLGWLCTGRNWPPLTGSLLRLAGVSAVLAVVYFAIVAVERMLS
jgi:membrane associated rhomboid family serine protease